MTQESATVPKPEGEPPPGQESVQRMPSASPVAHGGQLPATMGADPAEADGAAENSVTTALGLSRGDVRFAFVCGGAILLLLVAYWVQSAFFGARLVEIDRLPERAYQFRLDINSATWVEWMQLDGIGEALARRIISDREQHGPFASIDDVSRVQGIGPKTLANIRPHLDCSDCPLPASPQ